ncbi:MAG: phosphotransferase, partial [Terriglobales bacterium]
CLVQSGVGGRQATMPGSRRPGAPLPPSWRAAAQWLEAFQRLAAARWPRPPRLLAELGMEACAQAHAHARRRPELRELLSVLPPVVAQAAAAVAPSPTAVAIHGDFWSGNALLLPGGRDASALRVIDWSGFGQGSALDDLLTWVAYSDCPRGAARQARLPRWQRRFFGSGSERAFLRAGAGRAGYSAAAARLGFHLFLLRRLGWELGLGLQTRTPAEHDEARGEWAMMLAWLAEQGFPDPFESGAAERGRR